MNYKEFFKEECSNPIKGGKGDNLDLSKFDKKTLKDAIKVEMEHTNDPKIALDVVRDHLKENPLYYKMLKKAGLADELKETGNMLKGLPGAPQPNMTTTSDEEDDNRGIVEPDTSAVDKQTVPNTTFPEIPDNPKQNVNVNACIVTSPNMITPNAQNSTKPTNVDATPKDPKPTDHVTGGMSSAEPNPAILSKSNQEIPKNSLDAAAMFNPLIPQDISFDVTEGKKILKNMMKDKAKEKTDEGYGGDPDTDKAYVKNKRWTVKFK